MVYYLTQTNQSQVGPVGWMITFHGRIGQD